MLHIPCLLLSFQRPHIHLLPLDHLALFPVEIPQDDDKAFYMREGEAITVSVDSRVMLNAALFRKMNPNYTRPVTQ